MTLQFNWPPRPLVRAVLRSNVETNGLAATVQLLAEVAEEPQRRPCLAEEPQPEPRPILAEHGRRIAAIERQLSSRS